MPTVTKGAMRMSKLRAERLSRAVPTLDLRRKQLNREILSWEEKMAELESLCQKLSDHYEKNPHPEIDFLVSIKDRNFVTLNIAGVIISSVEKVDFEVRRYSVLMTPPSFDLFVNLRKELMEANEKYAAMKKGLELLGEELSVTTQRINLFEKRLIPMYKGEIRYIKGRLEDNERATVMVAKIAQAEMLAEKSTFETA